MSDYDCEICGPGNLCDVCHKHDEPLPCIECEGPYVFPNRPVQRSSSGVLVARGDNTACPTCGCRQPKIGAVGFVTKIEMKLGCKCICHRGRND